MSRSCCLLLLLLLVGLPGQMLRAEQILANTERNGVKVVALGLYDALPRAGHVPVRIEIHNRTQSDGAWGVYFASGYGEQGLRLETLLPVEAGKIGNFRLSVPVTPTNSSNRPSIYFRLNGPGIDNLTTSYSHTRFGNPSSNRSSFFLMSDDLAIDNWGTLDSAMKKVGDSFDATRLEVEDFSSDYRDWLGVTHAFFSISAFSQLDGLQRAAVATWLSQGGNLIFCPDGETLSIPAFFPSAEQNEQEWRIGAGRIEVLPMVSGKIPPETFQKALNLRKKDHPADALERRISQTDGLTAGIDPPGLNEGLLIGIALIFALAVAPANLIWLTRRRQRHLLFLTIPALSIVASLILIAAIFIGDGLGGKGNRATLVLWQPDRAEKLLINEEFSVTGMLLGRDFETSETVAMMPLLGAMGINAYELARDSQYEMAVNPQGRHWANWYASRSLRAFLVTELKPTRETVAIEKTETGYRVLSQSPTTFDEFYFIDEDGNPYHASNVKTGIHQDLKTVDRDRWQAWWDERCDLLGPRGQQVASEYRKPPGTFMASAPGSDENCTRTLSSIRFDETVLILGQVKMP